MNWKVYFVKGFYPKTRFPDKAPKEYQRAAAHLVRPSPWPVLTAFSLGSLLLSSAAYFHMFTNSFYYLLLSLVTLIISMFSWFSGVFPDKTSIININVSSSIVNRESVNESLFTRIKAVDSSMITSGKGHRDFIFC